MEKLEMMYEGKAKKIYATDKADEVIEIGRASCRERV